MLGKIATFSVIGLASQTALATNLEHHEVTRRQFNDLQAEVDRNTAAREFVEQAWGDAGPFGAEILEDAAEYIVEKFQEFLVYV